MSKAMKVTKNYRRGRVIITTTDGNDWDVLVLAPGPDGAGPEGAILGENDAGNKHQALARGMRLIDKHIAALDPVHKPPLKKTKPPPGEPLHPLEVASRAIMEHARVSGITVTEREPTPTGRLIVNFVPRRKLSPPPPHSASPPPPQVRDPNRFYDIKLTGFELETLDTHHRKKFGPASTELDRAILQSREIGSPARPRNGSHAVRFTGDVLEALAAYASNQANSNVTGNCNLTASQFFRVASTLLKALGDEDRARYSLGMAEETLAVAMAAEPDRHHTLSARRRPRHV